MPNLNAYQAIQDLVIEKAAIWEPRQGISHWEIRHVFLDSFFGDDGEEDFKITAVTEARWNYEQAKVKWYLPSAVRHSLEYIEFVLVHENVHIMLAAEQTIPSKLAEAIGSIDESWFDAQHEKIELGTEKVARALWRAYNPGKPLPEAS